MVVVRSATADDVPDIRCVASDSWYTAYGDILDESVIDGRLSEWYNEETVERAVTAEQVVYLVATVDGDVVGYASGGEGEEGGPETATLSSIYVHPDRWGEGVGQQLLADLCGRLRERGFERLRAVVLADNDVGIPFYENEGFERVAERTDSLGEESHDEVIFEREL